ncbi:MAG TPA: hypothetical protein VFV38_10325 [Ktedonobacteraceae bacterium]|nr:hypothetical protein [Ktedonobacteraceae bacterium]
MTTDTKYKQMISSKARNPRVSQIALEMLLLYGKAYISTPFDNLDLEPLMKLGLVEEAPHNWNSLAVDEEHAKSIKALLLADLHRHKVQITSLQFDELIGESNDLRLGTIVALAEQLQPRLEQLFGITSIENSTADKRTASDLFGFGEQLQKAKAKTPQEIELASQLHSTYHHMRNLMEASSQLQAPILTSITNVHKVETNWTGQSFHKNARIAVGIYLHENLLIPKIDTIEDVLRLREDPHIHHFRRKIFSWAEKLQNGELGTEEAIRREIHEANEAIRGLGKWRTISAWTTYVSVGLDVFSLFLGNLPITLMTTTPLGLF